MRPRRRNISTEQAEGNNSDCILKPCFSCPDPIRGEGNVLVLCEVMDSMGNPHPTNSRHQLKEVIDSTVEMEDPWFGFEQEYTMVSSRLSLANHTTT